MASTTQDFNGWRSEILEHIFNEEDSKEIQQMSLVNIVGQDKIIWRLGSNGDYLVRLVPSPYGEYVGQ